MNFSRCPPIGFCWRPMHLMHFPSQSQTPSIWLKAILPFPNFSRPKNNLPQQVHNKVLCFVPLLMHQHCRERLSITRQTSKMYFTESFIHRWLMDIYVRLISLKSERGINWWFNNLATQGSRLKKKV